jgi:hypothetical protein
MALYIPLSRRRRNAALVAVATLLIGLVVGLLIGRSTAVTASEAARDVRSQGDTLGTRLEALTIEYDQAVAGTGDTVQAGVIDALDRIVADMDRLIAEAPWLGAAQKARLHAATTDVRTAASDLVSPDQFAEVVSASAGTLRAVFGADT